MSDYKKTIIPGEFTTHLDKRLQIETIMGKPDYCAQRGDSFVYEYQLLGKYGNIVILTLSIDADGNVTRELS